MSMRIDVSLVRTLEDRLYAEWRALHESGEQSHPMQHPDFIRMILHMAPEQGRPMILLAHSEGRLVGVLPLGGQVRQIGPCALREIRRLSPGRYDLTIALAEPSAAMLINREFANAIAELRLQGHEINLSGVPTTERMFAALPSDWHTQETAPLWYAQLTGSASWEDVILVPHQRRDIRRRAKLLAKEHGEPGVAWACDGTEAATMTRAFVDLHASQQTGKGRVSAFGSSLVADALTSYLALAVPAGRADVGTLQFEDGRVLAAEILLYSRGVAYRYRTTYDMAWSRYGPGNILLAASVDRVIGRGYPTFELGWGIEPYKANWGTAVGSVCRVQAAPPRHRAIGYRLLRRLGLGVADVAPE